MERRSVRMLLIATIAHLCHGSYLSQVYFSCRTSSPASRPANLHALIDSLLQQAPLTGFNTSVVERHPAVYGLAQCRGDLSEDACKHCLSATSAQMLEICPQSTAAKLQLDGCFLGYSNSNNIFYQNSAVKNKLEYQSCGSEAKENTQELRSNINRLVSSLKSQAPTQRKKFACHATGSGLNKVYGLAQCQFDMDTEECASCLSFVASQICKDNSTVGASYYSSYCYLRYEKYAFFNVSDDESPLKDGSIVEGSSHHSDTAIIIGIIGAAIAVSASCLLSAFITRGKLGSTLFNSSKGTNRDYDFDPDIGPSIFTYEDIRLATRNFHDDNKLGKGGFGEVYKGVFPGGREMAVKRLSSSSYQARKEFLNEVKLNSCIQHRNLLRLLGCCTDGSERILVYEYMRNRSLDNLLFGAQSELFLDWRTRRSIIIGVARGLSYLHEDSQVSIVHRDIKLCNILVDDNFIPKIGDFGLALHYNADACNAKVAGTLGYMPPECAMRAKLTKKVDIYSFGVLTLEIISGRRNKDLGQPSEMQYLLDWAWRLCEEGKVEEVIDRRLLEGCEGVRDEMVLFVHMALLCAQEDARMRPDMGRVLLMMAGVADMSVLPDSRRGEEDEEEEQGKGQQCNTMGIFSGSIGAILSAAALKRAASMQHRPKSGALDGDPPPSASRPSSHATVTLSQVEPR